MVSNRSYMGEIVVKTKNFNNYKKRSKKLNNLHYNRKRLKDRAIIGVAGLTSATTAFASCMLMPSTSATPCSSSPCNTTFQVNVKDTLTVDITPDSSDNTGDVGDFLRNKVGLAVTTNNANGFTASMYSKTDTALTNANNNTYSIPTLTSSTTRSNISDKWGYSLGVSSFNGNNYGESDAGNTSSTYYPMVSSTSSPITVLNGAAGTTSGNQNIYFGTKATSSTVSGTYTGTVVISVVTGTVDSSTNPITPTDPATPNSTDNTAVYNASPTGGSTNGTTTYTTRSTSPSPIKPTRTVTTTSTQVSDGDNTDSYAPPQGVSHSTQSSLASTSANIAPNDSSLATGLAITSAVTAVAGVSFFVIAKRREDDEDED